MFSFDDIPASGGEVLKSAEISDVIRIKVVGVGGGGCNAVSHMMREGVKGIKFTAINTDRPALNVSAADFKLQIGEKITGGKGAGSDPNVGRKSAEESKNSIQKIFEDTDLVFITAGMGGGTGTGAAPIVAEAARSAGVLTVGVVTKPFPFEGARKARIADEGIEKLKSQVDTLIVIPNEKLSKVSPEKITLANAFAIADGVLRQAVVGIADVLRRTNFINLDFADLRTILKDAGFAHIGIGRAEKKDKVINATTQAIQSPLMETSIRGARRVLINITGSPDLLYDEVEEVVGAVKEAASADANIIFGMGLDEGLSDELIVVVIATDFDESSGLDGIEFLKDKIPIDKAHSPKVKNSEPNDDDNDDDWEEMDKLLKDLGVSGKDHK
ncbi:MAG: cell division protein FtsZ [Oscillospiraceae bacterium]|jgi:cell division protein FtsZ|nr:cell division protein FtsZ [Oscillospiraceae bacterium]